MKNTSKRISVFAVLVLAMIITLIIAASPHIAGAVEVVSPTCNYEGRGMIYPEYGPYIAGQTLSINAVPAPGWQFAFFKRNGVEVTPHENPGVFPNLQDREVFTAVFTPQSCTPNPTGPPTETVLNPVSGSAVAARDVNYGGHTIAKGLVAGISLDSPTAEGAQIYTKIGVAVVGLDSGWTEQVATITDIYQPYVKMSFKIQTSDTSFSTTSGDIFDDAGTTQLPGTINFVKVLAWMLDRLNPYGLGVFGLVTDLYTPPPSPPNIGWTGGGTGSIEAYDRQLMQRAPTITQDCVAGDVLHTFSATLSTHFNNEGNYPLTITAQAEIWIQDFNVYTNRYGTFVSYLQIPVDTITLTYQVNPLVDLPPDELSMNYLQGATGYRGTSYSYYFLARQLYSNALQYYVDWGDGSTTLSDWISQVGTGVTEGHSWSSVGSKQITFWVRDSYDLWSQPSSYPMTIVNRLPYTSNLRISPSSPTTMNSLTALYDYNDPDGDSQAGYEINWYKGSQIQSAYNDQMSIPAYVAKKGEQWYFTIRVSDGMDYGSWQQSPSVTIVNCPPFAYNLAITPSSPRTIDAMTATGIYYDPDGDHESGSELRWYMNGQLQAAFNNQFTIPAYVADRGQTWWFTSKPCDGTSFGTLQMSPHVTIINSPPPTPNRPLGDASGARNVWLSYSVTPAYDPDGDWVYYEFNWDDAGPTTIAGPYSSGLDIGTVYHEWSSLGTYHVTVRVHDSYDAYSGWSQPLTVTISDRRPDVASKPSGFANGYVYNSEYYSTSATDPDGDTVRYYFSFGDQIVGPTQYYASGATASMSYSWTRPGTYSITTLCQDCHGAVSSSWSDPLIVTITQADGGYSGVDAGNTSSTALQIYGTSFAGTMYQAHGGSAADNNDWYKIQVDGTGSITVHMTPPSNANFELELYNPSGTPVAYSHNGQGQAEDINYANGYSGTWKIRVFIYSGDTNGEGLYSCTLSYPHGGGGEGCPTIFSWNGQSYVDYGVANIHDPSGENVIRETRIRTEDVAVTNNQAQFRLREGWPGLNFSESFIDKVQLYVYDGDGHRYLCPLTKAYDSKLGDVKSQLLRTDGNRVQTLLLDAIDLTFVIPCKTVQSYTLVIEGCNMYKM